MPEPWPTKLPVAATTPPPVTAPVMPVQLPLQPPGSAVAAVAGVLPVSKVCGAQVAHTRSAAAVAAAE